MSLQVPSSSSQENSHQQQQQMQQYEQLQLQQKSMLDALRAKLESNRELFEQVCTVLYFILKQVFARCVDSMNTIIVRV